MSGSISSTFRYGPLCRWALTVSYRWDDAGELAYARVALETRYDVREPVWGTLTVAALPGGGHVDGYDLVRDLLVNGGGGHDRQMRVAEWMIGNLREAVEHRAALPANVRTLWGKLVDQSDDAHADWFGRFGDLDPDTAVQVETHPFQVVNTWLFDRLFGAAVTA